MQREGGGRCSECQYWQPYQTSEGFGVCDYPEGRYYDEQIPASDAPCEGFIPRPQTLRTCGDCTDWYPLDVSPQLGECRSQFSPRSGRPILRDAVAGDCFEGKSLVNLEFAWCGTCRQTVPKSDLGAHRSHKLFRGTSQFSVEEMMEFTTAAD